MARYLWSGNQAVASVLPTANSGATTSEPPPCVKIFTAILRCSISMGTLNVLHDVLEWGFIFGSLGLLHLKPEIDDPTTFIPPHDVTAADDRFENISIGSTIYISR